MPMSEEHARMVADCSARESKLSEWEADFINSLDERDRPLSNRQEEILERIWNSVT